MLDDIAPTQDPDAMQDGNAAAEADLSQPLAKQKLLYCERFVEFLTDLLSQLPTRRFIRTLLEDRAILTKCRMSALFQNSQGTLQCCHSQGADGYVHCWCMSAVLKDKSGLTQPLLIAVGGHYCVTALILI